MSLHLEVFGRLHTALFFLPLPYEGKLVTANILMDQLSCSPEGIVMCDVAEQSFSMPSEVLFLMNMTGAVCNVKVATLRNKGVCSGNNFAVISLG